MKQRPKRPAIPSERGATIRQEITEVLAGRSLSAKEISAAVGIPEKEVYEHLFHIQKTLARHDTHLHVDPSVCMKCGFVFGKRDRLKKPGRCPVCRAEQISDPLFSVT